MKKIIIAVFGGSAMLSGLAAGYCFSQNITNYGWLCVLISMILLLILSSFLTGVSVCFTGVIGFVDLTIPHIVRKIYGSSHRIVVPMSFVLGGAFMTVCDMVSRTVAAPVEIPVGAVTALIGAPFFVILFLRGRKQG